MRRLAVPFLALLLGSATLPAPAQAGLTPAATASLDSASPSDPRAAIEAAIGEDDTVTLGGVVLKAKDVRELYAGRGWFPLWIDFDGRLDPRVQPILARLAEAREEGLVPSDYYVEPLQELIRSADADDVVAAEILLSAAVMRYGVDVHAGRLAPREIDKTFDITPKPVDRAALATAASMLPDPDAFLADLAPKHKLYQQLKGALRGYEALAESGWPTIPPGESLRPGQESDRVPVLRARLAATGEFVGDPADQSRLYDPLLVTAVEQFQGKHGLKPDGILGRGTLAMLNRQGPERMNKIIASMERLRWLPDDLGADYLMVNIAAFTMDVVADGQLLRSMNVVVGETDNQTPLFNSALTYLEFNPTWTVPPSIAAKEYLPRLRNNPGYLASRNYKLFSGWGSGSREMSADYVDWNSIGRGTMRSLRIRQEPGPGNALGKVKFMMANNWSVYLHDTPSKSYFQRANRALSHGCVRLQDPIWLADYLLEGAPSWTPERRARVMGNWTPTTRINLPTPMPLYIVYQTAWIDQTGEVAFRDDIYGIDAKVIAALQARETRREQLASSR
ncbi:L,D-transpeptidase family protein [Inquilinus limosus]|uniref:L,D-transpeptidase family protein n=1 Tax=Inquilinus limosus TaxID=171674 RepID=UPI003F168CD4